MKFNKIAVLLAVFSLVFALTACGSSKTAETPAATETKTAQSTDAATTTTDDAIKPEEGAKLTVWESKEERAYTDQIAQEFTAKYGVPVTVEEVSPTDQVGKLTQDGPSGLAADVVIFPHDNLGKAVSANLILPNDIFEKETKEQNTEASITGASYGGTLYGYPRSAETYALYYNKDLVKEAPTSFEQVIEISKKLTDKSKNKYGLMWEAGNFYFTYPFFASTGGYVFGKNGTDKSDIGLNNAGALEGMKVYQSLREILPVKTGDITPDIKRGLFTSGDVAMDINGPWELAGYKQALGDKLGIAPIPTIGGKPAISFSGIKAWYVNAYTPYPNAAKLFAHFATDKHGQLVLNEKVGSVPTNLEAQKDPQVANDPYVSAFAEQSKNSQPMPSIPEMGNVWAPVGAALSEIWDSGKDPKAALDNAVKQIQDLNNGATAK
ncbi:maltose ABC transporter substrate-binding protein [Paenibacillus sediminis]|uniref:Maltodextrin-binding protein n=1 Tax=Paenibacillus sediminis TaxID=664909 RepID=A0ABS4H4C7_9BACL|nr:maltose ABC transporter substrate-binding protein [Paenibacillus sediminis]MBP1936955.1 arabinogalactan oligomer/maltooligosaccharide transport system substrate-binding protein [Paenibacillus sediminis]